jgi:hypothetical protein
VHRLLVDTDNPEARLFQKHNNLAPARRIVPIFGLGRALRSDADIRFRHGPCVIRQSYARRHFGRIDAKDITGGAAEPTGAMSLDDITNSSHLPGGANTHVNTGKGRRTSPFGYHGSLISRRQPLILAGFRPNPSI